MKWPKPEILKNKQEVDINYCDNSSIHGIKYISHKKSRSIPERLLWAVSLLISFLFCGYWIANVYKKRCDSPVIVSFNEVPIPVWKIPFPAITICSETKTRRDVFRYTETFLKIKENNLSKIEWEQFNVINQLCLEDWDQNVSSNFDGTNFIQIMKTLAPHFNRTFHVCGFVNMDFACDAVYSPIITDAGLCYTFNGLSGEEIFRTVELADDFLLNKSENSTLNWSNEDGYLTDDIVTYPTRGFDASLKYGYVALLQSFENDFDYTCRGSTQGFQLVVHNPADHPKFSEEYHKIQLDKEIVIKVQPRMIKTTPTLINVPPEKRGCFFSHERYLRFFKIYTKSNCDMECITNFTVSNCGCARFYMPRIKTTRICNVNDINCYNSAQFNLTSIEIEQKLEEDTESTEKNCNCMPVCNSLDYDTDITDARFGLKEFAAARRMPWNLSKESQHAKINVFFKTSEFIAKKRSELYTNTDFLANCGGLVGMFLGASVLSIFEICYFCALRLILLLRRDPERHAKKEGGITFVTPVKSYQ